MRINENESKIAKKNGIKVFFAVWFRKFHRLAAINLIWFLITLPILIYAYLAANTIGSGLLSNSGVDILPGIGVFAYLMRFIPSRVFSPIFIISVLIYGPLKMGVTYVMKEYSRQRHAWLSDIFAKAILNFRQGLFFGILDLCLILFLFPLICSANFGEEYGLAQLDSLASMLILIFIFFYFNIRRYFYLIAVTIELSVFEIIKNACILTIAGLGRSAAASALEFMAWSAAILISPVISMAAIPLVLYSFLNLVAAFICYPMVNKHILVPAQKLNAEKSIKRQGL